MTDQELVELIAAGETPGVEFKNARDSTAPSFIEVVRAALGMANRRDGGVIIIGVDNDGNAPGLAARQVGSWQNPDHTRQAIALFADPCIYLNVEVKTVAVAGPLQGRVFAVIAVSEFEEVPVLCARSANNTANQPNYLKQGACYVRPHHLPATSEVANQTQLRALLDLAIEKGVRKFLRTARAVGLPVDGAPAPDDDALFQAQAAAIDE